MVKFSQYYESIVSARPEWRKAYINYHALNQLVCSVRERQRADTATIVPQSSATNLVYATRDVVTGAAGGAIHGVEAVVGGVAHGVGGVVKGVGDAVAGAVRMGMHKDSDSHKSDESMKTAGGSLVAPPSGTLPPNRSAAAATPAAASRGAPPTDQTPLLAPASTSNRSPAVAHTTGSKKKDNRNDSDYHQRQFSLDDGDDNVTKTLLRENMMSGFGGTPGTSSFFGQRHTSQAHSNQQHSINYGGTATDEDVSPYASMPSPPHPVARGTRVTSSNDGDDDEDVAPAVDDDDDAADAVDPGNSNSTNVVVRSAMPLTNRLPSDLAEEFERLFTIEVDKATRFAMDALKKYFKYYEDNVDKWRSKRANQKRIKSNVRYLFNELLQLIQFAETNLLCVKILVRKYCKAHPSGFMSQVLRGELPMLIRTSEPLMQHLAMHVGGSSTRPVRHSHRGGQRGQTTSPAFAPAEATTTTNFALSPGAQSAFGLGAGANSVTSVAFGSRRNQSGVGHGTTSPLLAPGGRQEESDLHGISPATVTNRSFGMPPKITASNVYQCDPDACGHGQHQHHALTTYIKAEGSDRAPPLNEEELEVARLTAEEVLIERLKLTMEKVENLRTIVSALWAELFTGGDITRAREHIVSGMKHVSPTQAFRVGILTALIFSCVLYWLHVVLELGPSDAVLDRFHLAFPVFRFLFAIPFFLIIWAMDLYVFKTMKINYLYVLELAPSNSVQWLQCLEFGLALMLILGVGTDLYVRSELQYTEGYYHTAAGFPSVSPYVFPVVMGIMFLSIAFPWRHVMWRSRNALARVLLHCLSLPFTYVAFVDFYVADWGTSMPQPLTDLTYTVCYFTALPSKDYGGDDGSVCSNVASRFGNFVAVIPYYWRMWQTFLMFRRTGSRVHLINFGKYVSCVTYMLVTIIQNNADPKQEVKLLGALVWFTHVGSQLYCFIWDILMDWGWIKGKARASMFSSNRPYVFATIFDFFARMFFIPVNLYLSDKMTKNYVTWVQVVVELTRRGVWSIFRIENENLNNLEMYRKIDFVPHVVMDEAD